MTSDINNQILDAALYLLEHKKWSIIPIAPKTKKALIEWKKYQKIRPTLDEIKKWFRSYPDANIAVITGKVSNLIVIDIDPRHGGTDEIFKDTKTVIAKTGGGGWHYYFKYEEGIQNKAGIQPGFDIRGEAGYSILPPSIHESGNKYEWLTPPDEVEPVSLPQFVKDWIAQGKPLKIKTQLAALQGVTEGQRNSVATSVAGKKLAKHPQNEWESHVWPFLVEWNKKNTPPLPKQELRATFESIASAEINKRLNPKTPPKRNVSDLLVDLVLSKDVELYLDQTREPHITFPDKPIVGFPVRSTEFRRWLAGLYWEEYEKGISGEQCNTAISSLEGKTYHNGVTQKLHNRIAREDNVIYYDLGDDQHVVTISSEGWEVTTNCPVKFHRFSHQSRQIEPQKGGNLSDVLDFINLSNESDKLLYLTYLVAVMIPDIPRVVLVNIGDQGAAKTTALRIARSLIDPSESDLLSPTRDIAELAQAAHHHYCLYLDNLSYLRDELSDALCRLTTGSGFTKRKLYTDDADVLFKQKVAIGITGINLVAQRADLLDRCLILNFERIPDNKRADEDEFWSNFENKKPQILGAIFTTLSKALKQVNTIKLPRKPRMADYAKYAVAATLALGQSQDSFLNAFNDNVNRQNQAAVESSPTAQVIIRFMSSVYGDEWSGSSSELHKALKKIAEDENLLMGGSDGFPKVSNWLWRRIMPVRSNLSAMGIIIKKHEEESGTVIEITKTSKVGEDVANVTSAASQDKPDEPQDGNMAAVATDELPFEDNGGENYE